MPEYITAVSDNTLRVHVSATNRTSVGHQGAASGGARLAPLSTWCQRHAQVAGNLASSCSCGCTFLLQSLGLEEAEAELPFLLDSKGTPLSKIPSTAA